MRILWYACLASTTQAACYFPNGRLAHNDSPCRDDTENSVCCGQGYACLTNGICQATGEELQKPGASEFVRGGCTDKSYRSSSCPQFCSDPLQDNVGGGHGLARCQDEERDMYFCVREITDNFNCTGSGQDILFFPGRSF